ncbi:hypothetical protein Shyhy02_43260 [Streptomyces hygroscopicus subsp. hygroscopicus]|nr:hypothetical protein Shyhy02_43260 [Streptomyces hygroscopicus subsp. hygroscopicus]
MHESATTLRGMVRRRAIAPGILRAEQSLATALSLSAELLAQDTEVIFAQQYVGRYRLRGEARNL